MEVCVFREALVKTVPFYTLFYSLQYQKPCLESDSNNSSKQSLAKPLPYIFPFNQLSAFYFLFVWNRQNILNLLNAFITIKRANEFTKLVLVTSVHVQEKLEKGFKRKALNPWKKKPKQNRKPQE